MNTKIVLMVKGFLLGIANIIPGVSGGALAISIGLYEKIINAISHLFNNFKENLKLLIPIGIGILCAITLLSKVINYTLEEYPLATIFLFIGLILGGVPMLLQKVNGHKKNISNIFLFAIVFSLIVMLPLLKSDISIVNFANLNFLGYILIFLVGVLWAGTMIIPGISGTFLLMLIGYYKPIIETFSNLTNINSLNRNILILVFLVSGLLFGIFLFSRLIEYLLKKWEIKMYFAIIGFLFSSIVLIFLQTNFGIVDFSQFIIGIVLLVLGIGISYRLST